MVYPIVGSVSVTRCDDGRPRKSSAMSRRSLWLSVSSMVRLPTAAPMNELMASGLVMDAFTLASTARKKASWRWMRLKSDWPS